MRKNVFMKSVIRRPIRNLVLTLLVGIACFAMTLRAAEFIFVSDEIARIESFFRSIGFLSTRDPLNRNYLDFSDNRWQDIIEQNRFVNFVDRRRMITGELEGMFNGDNTRLAFSSPYLHERSWHDFETEYGLTDAYFIGTLTAMTIHQQPTQETVRGIHFYAPSSPALGSPAFPIGGTYAILRFEDLEVIFGRTEHVREEFLVRVIVPIEDIVTHEGIRSWDEVLLDIGMEIGGRYLIRGTFDHTLRVMGIIPLWAAFHPENLDLGGTNFRLRDGIPVFPHTLVIRPLGAGTDALFFPADDPDLLEDKLLRLVPQIENLDRNKRSVTVIPTKDMTAVHAIDAHLGEITLMGGIGGRWINHQDYLNANPVVMLPFRFSSFHGLEVGDTIELTLRENIPGVLPYNYDGWRDERTHTLTLEIVGFYNLPIFALDHGGAAWANGLQTDLPYFSHWLRDMAYRFASHFIYLPASLIPYDFTLYDDHLSWDNRFSFVLNSARYERAFIEEVRPYLSELGINLHFVPMPESDDFFFAVDTINLTLIFNLTIFSITCILALSFGSFIYTMLMRRNFAIMRGLGHSIIKSSRQMLTPITLLWIPVIIIGTIIAWMFAMDIAQSTIAPVIDIDPHMVHLGVEFNPNLQWLLALMIVVASASLTAVIIGIISIASKPVLVLLQKVGR